MFKFEYITTSQYHPSINGVYWSGPHWSVYDEEGTLICWGKTKVDAGIRLGEYQTLQALYNDPEWEQKQQVMDRAASLNLVLTEAPVAPRKKAKGKGKKAGK